MPVSSLETSEESKVMLKNSLVGCLFAILLLILPLSSASAVGVIMDRNSLSNSVTEKQKAEVKNWWHAFSTNEPKIISSFSKSTKGDFNLANWMNENLGKIDPNIMWEYGPGVNKKHSLLLTPQTKAYLRPLVRYIISQAPKFSNWEFYEYRLPEGQELAEFVIRGKTGWDNISKISYKLTPGIFNSIDITFYVPYSGSEVELKEKALTLIETLLGEESLGKWVGGINVEKKSKLQLFGSNSPQNSVATLKSDFEAKVKEIKGSFVPYCKLANDKNHKWAIAELKRKPEAQKAADIKKPLPEYSGKDDLLITTFINKDLLSAMLEGGSVFYSERFSNKETFIYIKIDGAANDLNQEIFQDRVSIENALNNALDKVNLGCVIGGGTGDRYSYIDLAVTDVPAAIKAIQNTLHQGKLTKNSWILFSDADLQAEWIGVWDDSPKPYIQIDKMQSF